MPQAQFPVWTAGQDITAGQVQMGIPFFAWKEVDLPRSNTASLANDGDLIIPLAANGRYQFDGRLYATGAALGTADLKFGFTWPAGANVKWDSELPNTSGTVVFNTARTVSGTSVAVGVNGSSAPTAALFSGFILNGPTAGSLILQWCQNTSNSTATNLLACSYIRAFRSQ